MDNITEHVTYKEGTKSGTATRYGIDNTPDECTLLRMKYVSNNIFEKVRAKFGKPIAVTSFYRSPEVNKKIGGASTKSQHCKGEAMDLDADVYGGLTNKDIFEYIYNNLEFDQLIWEYGDDNNPSWVHVSLNVTKNKKQALVAYKQGGRTKYKRYDG
jgi:zinc D-Ala-D-Ala carboxypeptidase